MSSGQTTQHRWQFQSSAWRDLLPLDAKEVAVAKLILHATGFECLSGVVNWSRPGYAPSTEFAITLLLCLPPRLWVAHLSIHFRYAQAYFISLVRTGLRKGHWQSLEDVQYCWCSGSSTVATATNLFWLFYLPKVKTVTFCAHDIDWMLSAPSEPQCHTLHTLKLPYSFVELSILKRILSWAPNLRRLEYRFCCVVEDNLALEWEHFLDCKELRETLEVRADSLEYLTLSLEILGSYPDGHRFDWHNTLFGVIGSLGDMSRFTLMKGLKAPIVMLLGWHSATEE